MKHALNTLSPLPWLASSSLRKCVGTRFHLLRRPGFTSSEDQAASMVVSWHLRFLQSLTYLDFFLLLVSTVCLPEITVYLIKISFLLSDCIFFTLTGHICLPLEAGFLRSWAGAVILLPQSVTSVLSHSAFCSLTFHWAPPWLYSVVLCHVF